MRRIIILTTIFVMIMSTNVMARQVYEMDSNGKLTEIKNYTWFDEIEEACITYQYGRKYEEFRYESADEILSDFGIPTTEKNIKIAKKLLEEELL